MLLGTLGASLLGNILARKGMNRAGEGAIAKNVSEETKLKRRSRDCKSWLWKQKISKNNNKK